VWGVSLALAVDGKPDIGAYEYGAAARPHLDVQVEELAGTGTVSSSPAGIACEQRVRPPLTKTRQSRSQRRPRPALASPGFRARETICFARRSYPPQALFWSPVSVQKPVVPVAWSLE